MKLQATEKYSEYYEVDAGADLSSETADSLSLWLIVMSKVTRGKKFLFQMLAIWSCREVA